ncbi:MAG: FAD-binding oxidoreductase, partial [Candidatus Omnitrophica bacterium]|nr:FAD-binding oxidoreductase [Candidatus Omnitrophota bacterium]
MIFKTTEAEVLEIINRTYNVKSFRVKPKEFMNFKAGQFMQVILKEEPEYTRYLSISNSPTERGYLEFTKKLTESKFSKALEELKV